MSVKEVVVTSLESITTNTTSTANLVVNDGIHQAMRVTQDPDYLSLNGEIVTGGRNITFVAKQTHDNLPLYYDRVSNGTATQTYNSTTCLTPMTTSASGDYAIAQSFMRPNYTAGCKYRWHSRYIGNRYNAFISGFIWLCGY